MAADETRGGQADELNLSNFMQNSGFLVFMFGPPLSGGARELL
jgi:cyanate permease